MIQAPTPLNVLNEFSQEDFVQSLETLYEYSPWIVEKAYSFRPFLTVKSLQAAFESIIYGSESTKQIELLKAHPDLAAKLEQIESLTDFSQAEQKRAGFAALPQGKLEALQTALAKYRSKFDHPFILCVSEHNATEVLPILEMRSQSNLDAERIACLAQVTRIGWHRLLQLVSEI
ncbi:2-oxo-4-hydroxy-4-carboxy-5-ureidoimidazoline decarboxylase [Puniceicoccaceae bacterium K14]|nr:2-oxo-4-hydroxy-4-carboxy-5-ureidoimidazoline decarboxylase [Puniceicoccaceae bacterium K14]